MAVNNFYRAIENLINYTVSFGAIKKDLQDEWEKYLCDTVTNYEALLLANNLAFILINLVTERIDQAVIKLFESDESELIEVVTHFSVKGKKIQKILKASSTSMHLKREK